MANKVVLDFEKPIVELDNKIKEMRELSSDADIGRDIDLLEEKVDRLRENIYSELTRWQRVQIARHPERPTTLDYVENVFEDFVELHGDRHMRDDPSIVGGFAKIDGMSVMIVGHQKGRDTKTNVMRNFGMPNPEGYRKARRLFETAEKFGKPIITFLDTPGAYPGIEAEDRGQAEAIARNLFVMAGLRTPIIVVIIGEGASGGAIGIGVGDRVLMLENSWYSVISPESCSSILWRSWDYKEQAAEALKLTAPDLMEIKVIDEIIKEPIGGAHSKHDEMFDTMYLKLVKELKSLRKVNPDKLVRKRKEKLYSIGVFVEEKK